MPTPPDRPVVDASTPPPSPDHAPERGRRFAKSAHIRIVAGQLKVARAEAEENPAGSFEFYCDEPSALGGEDRYPPPLTYIAAGVGF